MQYLESPFDCDISALHHIRSISHKTYPDISNTNLEQRRLGEDGLAAILDYHWWPAVLKNGCNALKSDEDKPQQRVDEWKAELCFW